MQSRGAPAAHGVQPTVGAMLRTVGQAEPPNRDCFPMHACTRSSECFVTLHSSTVRPCRHHVQHCLDVTKLAPPDALHPKLPRSPGCLRHALSQAAPARRWRRRYRRCTAVGAPPARGRMGSMCRRTGDRSLSRGPGSARSANCSARPARGRVPRASSQARQAVTWSATISWPA